MKKKLCLLILLSSLLYGCSKEDFSFNISPYPARFIVDVNGMDSDLHEFSYKTFLKGRFDGELVGLGGLLVFRSYDGKIYAYDLACPYEGDPSVKVVPNDNGRAVCSKCGNEYILLYGEEDRDGIRGLGMVVEGKGPKTKPLWTYLVTRKLGSGEFMITN